MISACRQRRRAPAAIRSWPAANPLMSAVVSRCAPQQTGLLFLPEPVALTLNHEGMAVMQQAVEDGRREDLVAEDGAPLRDHLVRGDKETAAFIPAGDQLEK